MRPSIVRGERRLVGGIRWCKGGDGAFAGRTMAMRCVAYGLRLR